MFHPVVIDEDGEIVKRPMWTTLNSAAVKQLMQQLDTFNIVSQTIIMNEADYKDIVEWSDSNFTFDELKVSS